MHARPTTIGKWRFSSRVVLAAAALGAIGGTVLSRAADKPGERLFEMRTYITHDGKLDALNKRFRDHTCALFEKHGMELVGFWTPVDGEGNKLVYLLAFPNREARDAAFKAFGADPDWKAAKAESEKDGPIVKQVIQEFLTPTDYSKMK